MPAGSSKSISRGFCLVVQAFSSWDVRVPLAVAKCNFLIGGRDRKLVVGSKGLLSCGGGISVLVVVGSIFVSGGTYQFAVGVQGSSKISERIVWRGNYGPPFEVSVVGDFSLVMFHDSSLCSIQISF